jgi:aarF domain-containing kinase
VERLSQTGPLGSVFLHLRIWLRAGALLAKFFPLLLLYPLTYLAPGLATLWLHLLLKATETSGPTYIKLGQWASTRRDLFSEAFCAQFSKLHVQVAPHPWTHTEHLLQQAFGEDWGSTLFFETQEPVGSGCVAQVYKAFASTASLGKDSIWRLGEASRLQLFSEAGAFGGLRDLVFEPGHLRKDWMPPENLADQSFLERLLLTEADLVGSNAGVSQAPGHPPEPVLFHCQPVLPTSYKQLTSHLHTELSQIRNTPKQVTSTLSFIHTLSVPYLNARDQKCFRFQIFLDFGVFAYTLAIGPKSKHKTHYVSSVP